MNNSKKRKCRALSEETKAKISRSNKGKPKSALHRIHISQAMVKYWRTVPYKPEDEYTQT